MDSVFTVTIMTFAFILLLSLALMYTSQIETFEPVLDGNCRLYPSQNLSCYEYLESCKPDYLRNQGHHDFLEDRLNDRKMSLRRGILQRLRVGSSGGANPSPGFCRIPYQEFQNFELNKCPPNFDFMGPDVGCVVKIGDKHKRSPTGDEALQAFAGHPTDPKNRIRAAVAGIVAAGSVAGVAGGFGAVAGVAGGVSGAAVAVTAATTTSVAAAAGGAAAVGAALGSTLIGTVAKSVKINTDSLMDYTGKANDSWTRGFTPITTIKKVSTAVAGKRKNVRIHTQFSPKLPTSSQFPELSQVIKEYEQDYFTKYNAFLAAPTRCGYINGRIWDKDNQTTGKEAIIPIIQKRFGNKYYSLLYKYTTEAFKQLKPKKLQDWYTKDFNWDKPEPKMDRMDDPMNMYSTIDEFINNPRETYRDPFLMSVMKTNKTRFSLIVEVCNQYNPNPLVTLEFIKYSTDMVDREKDDVASNSKLNDPVTKKRRNEILKDSMKWFAKWRLKDSPFTTNKRLLYEQFNCETFSIDAGPEQSWTIGYVGKKPNCQDHRVFFTIPTGSSCPWQQWFQGNIVVSPDEAINLGGNIQDFNEFRKKHIGEWMNVWICAENDDPFQVMEMVKGIPNFNPYAFRDIFLRKPGQSDAAWAMYIWKTISKDGAAAQYNDTYKALVKKVKGKNSITFADYRMACDAALSNTTTATTAREAGCI